MCVCVCVIEDETVGTNDSRTVSNGCPTIVAMTPLYEPARKSIIGEIFFFFFDELGGNVALFDLPILAFYLLSRSTFFRFSNQ